MAATNWTAIFRETKESIIAFTNYKSKMTYKTALAIAKESIDDDSNFELVCIVETRRIMTKNDKEDKNNKELHNE